VDRRGQQVTAKLPLEVVPPPDGNKLAARLLGVQFSTLPEPIRRRFRLPKDVGLIVTSVARNSAAAAARLEEGDLVLSMNRVPVGSSSDVGLALEGVEPGEYVMLGGIRPDEDDPFKWDVTLRAER
jgi:S1-C subfamily serine protease